MSIKKIIVTGKTIDPIEAGALRGAAKTTLVPTSLKLQKTIELGGSNRGVQDEETIDLDENIVEFIFEDETTWMCDSSNLHEVFDEPATSREISGAFRIPAVIKDSSTERGIVGTIAAKFLRVFLKESIKSGVVAIAEKMEAKHLGDREGLNFLNKAFGFTRFSIPDSTKPTGPYLLFIHGTNSDTKGAYSQLVESEGWNYIFNSYGKNVLAFEHRTLTESPLENALALATQLPDNAEIHIISHSRGGLIGDILCRYSNDESSQVRGFSEANIALLAKEKRTRDIDAISALNDVYSKKKINIKKFVRVACPAAGTKLASKRMDQIFNVLYNLLGREANEIAVILKELIAETLKTKENVNVLPGIEAMSPASPFIRVLNDHADEMGIDGSSLAVISGNGKTSLSFRGLFIILARLFYEQRNDLVVNTDSMYLGVQRKTAIQYFFDEGKTVDHITYFKKTNKTCGALIEALRTENGKPIPGFKTQGQYTVPASDRGLIPKLEHGELFPDLAMPTGKRDIVVLLPGIMGSNLERKPDKLWLAYLLSIVGGLTELKYVPESDIKATSLIASSYKKLADRLSLTYDVVIYPFDWRKSLTDCTEAFETEIKRLLTFKKKIKIIAHSMGGLLVRDFIINHNATWQLLNASPEFKLIFLGTPLGGSHRIPAVLFGNDPIINSLSMIDRVNTKKELIKLFSNFPGLLCLLPLTTGKNERGESQDFADVDTWKKMRDAFGDSLWPIPDPDSMLSGFKAYRENVDSKKDLIDYSNMVYIAGKDKYTPCDYYNDTIPPRTELVFLYTGEGDQSVTWESAIPKKMSEAGNVYYVNVTHGALANAKEIFPAIEEILARGGTSLISKNKPTVRGEEKLFRMPEQFNFDFSESGIEKAVFGITEKNNQEASKIAVSVSVSHGDLAYASFPVLAGHFLNDGILYAEKSIDKLMDGTLSARKALGIYPGKIGTSAALATNFAENDFPGAIIIGLGEAGTLTAFLLIQSVEQAVSKYILDMNSQPDTKTDLGISALIIGCGYGGLSVENSIRAIIEGVNNANSKVDEVGNSNLRLIKYIEFIELYEDKALTCMYALRKIETGENSIYNITIGSKSIKTLFGCKRRLPVDFSDEWWRRITVKAKKSKDDLKDPDILVFNASTGNAREEQTDLSTSKDLIDLFVQQISDKNEWSACSAKTLFELMIPNSLKEELKRKGHISWILEPATAAYPWELLQPGIGDDITPLCVNAGMIRQLSTLNFRDTIQRVANDKALIIGDPLLDGFAPQLPGAKQEAEIVDGLLQTYGRTTLISKNSAEIIQSLFCDEYKIIHLAGHGFFNGGERGKSGMVIGKNLFLTTADINQMNTVPELVFVNCCHLGKIEPGQEDIYHDKYKLAANMGTQLIEMGVKAVIVAGWAVDDRAAHNFAKEFYTMILSGYNFGDSVKKARSVIYNGSHHLNNTWGAYQCYGDPFYKLITTSPGSKKENRYIMTNEVEIDLQNLFDDLNTKNYSYRDALDKLDSIQEKREKSEIKDGNTKELVAQIYYELGEYKKSAQAFESLKDAKEARFSVAALEKYCNVRCKQYTEDFKKTPPPSTLLSDIDKVIKELEMLREISETSERFSLLGSAYKRKGLLFGDSNNDEKIKAYSKAAEYYFQAWELANDDHYSYKNCLTLSCILDMVAKTNSFKSKKYLKDNNPIAIEKLEKRRLLLKQPYRNMDYWELIEDAAIDCAILILDAGKAKDTVNWTNLENKFKRIWKKAGSRGKRKAEVETFEIMIDALSMTTNPHAILLRKNLVAVNNQLIALIEDK